MSYDLVIKNGTVVDGTGAKRYQADVAIADGKVAEIGKVTEGAKRTIDADGLVVAPGFVDPHTHYDAQICWDGAVTPSSWHGVTSVVMGNCGVGIAPCKPETREIAMRDLVNVEGIPFDVLNKGITWDWETFPEFMDAAAARKPSLNLAFIAPLTPFRHYVMGEASMERAATPEETAKIARLIGEAVDAGALGFSSTTLNQHHRLRGQAAGLPQRQPRGAEGLRQPAQEARQGRDRDRADPPGRRARGGPVRAAGLPADRERPAGDLHRPVRPRRHSRGGARHAAPRRADDRQGRAAADLAAAADARSRHEQSVLLRRLPGVEARVRRHLEGGAEEGLCRSRLPQPVPPRPQEPDGLQQLGPHRRLRRREPGAEAARRQVDRRDRPGAGQGRRRCLPRPGAGRQSRVRAHHGLVEHARGPHARAVEQQRRS